MAEQSARLFEDHGYVTLVDHSALRTRDREAAHEAFRRERAAVLIAVRTVDEGVDVPDADVAIILSGTLTGRQRIQRIGRILRPSGSTAMCYSLLARGTSEESIVGAADASLLGPERVRHHRWPTTPFGNLAALASSYQPDLGHNTDNILDDRVSHGDRAALSTNTVGRSLVRGGPKRSAVQFLQCQRCRAFVSADSKSCRFCGGGLKPPDKNRRR